MSNLTVSWSAPTQNTDNSPITGPITYNLYAAPAATGPWTQVATGLTTTSSVRTNVDTGIHFYYVTSVVAGIESDPSASVSVTVAAPPSKPNPPTNIQIALS